MFNLQEVTESYMYAIATAFVPLGLVSVTFFVAIFVNNWFQGKMVFFRFGMILLVLFFSYQIAWSYSYLRHNSGRITHHYMKKIYPRPTALSVTNFQRSFFCFISGVVPQKFFGSKQNYPVLDPPDLEEILPKRTVVLVIGESLRFDRLSLLGYDKPTTPQLDQLYADKEIYADWIYAGGTVTKTAVSVVLNRLKYPGDSALTSRQKNSLFKLAKDNGFTTYFFSAQKKSKMSFLDSLICKKCIDHYKNRTDYKNEHAGASRYDDILLSITEEIDWSKSSFVVLQQRGSHSPYAKQVPSKYKKFENDYDNTVLYTDYILASLLRKIRGKCKNDLYFMFVSDHGELLGESGKNGHGWFEKEVYKIPFIFYADRKNREILPKIRSQFDVSNLVATALGYRVQWDPPDEDLYINGPDLNALGGYLHLKMAGKKILKKELVR
ncbi:MAG: phosphoethanolamine transferase [Desulfuromusa sp.]|nr:phosphoethanolamine transferase [Desulfuromusa sp.]